MLTDKDGYEFLAQRIHQAKVGKFQLFDLANDSYELNSLADNPQHADLMTQLQDKLRAWQKEVGDPAVDTPVRSNVVQ